jgi:thiamine-phosphate pyrophosphorylase
MHEVRTDVPAARLARAARVHGLYAVTPDIGDAAVLVRNVTAALAGGATVIQYRNKTADAAVRLQQARALAGLQAMREAVFIVNDDVDLAAAVAADGVHLGEDDPPIAAARERLGPERLIGVSCYDDWHRARAAVDAGADYVAFGSFFASSSKPATRRADRGLLSRARALGVPIVAIGGITSSNAGALIDAGATAVAVIADVFAHADSANITRAASRFAALFAVRTESEGGSE